ncbi:molybdopterin molybdotransferase MoeA [Pseudoalteromonas sp. T1lg23B]|uniref:molybdopterin molybdotransferase MoeA n=1 Tax=Pseudoalteromonas sp. T1lg23B TaxID=2077097 RepID=UPI000CF60E8F|nr:gephyrin-like molybdotransferase Glp [Pseudoalteromonas sp. T1lg23B]
MNEQKLSLLSFDEAVTTLLEDNIPFVGAEAIPLHNAKQRILACDISAPFDVPGYNNSAMDGYAIRHEDLQQFTQFELIGSALAGHPFEGKWQLGSCIRIMTGAAIPEGFDTVIMQEQAISQSEGDKTLVQFSITPKRLDHVRQQGEDIASGAILFEQGKRLKATDIGMLASIGIATVSVFNPLKVAILSTGDELCEPGTLKRASEIYDINRYTTRAILENLGFEVVDLGIIPDDPAAITSAFKLALSSADVVLSSGGVSVGAADHTKTVLNELGNMQFWKVAIKPGKPFAYGHFHTCNQQGHNKRFFGLPGNPVSSVVTLHQLALPALRKMAGENTTLVPSQRLPLAVSITKKPGRMEFIRAALETGPTATKVTPLQGQGSGILSTFSHSNGYIVLEAEGTHWQENDLVTYIPFDQALN